MANPRIYAIGSCLRTVLTPYKAILVATVFTALLSTQFLVAQNRTNSTETAHKALPSPAATEAPAPPAPTPAPAPPAPSTPEQMPARPPQVSGGHGSLTIVAENSTLSDILDLVKERTGAQIDIPDGAGDERVVVHLGPGPARDVLTTLFYGMPFNYVIEGSDTDPLEVRTVVLTKRTAAASTAVARSFAPPPVRTTYNAPDPEPVALNDSSVIQPTASEPETPSNAGRLGGERPSVAEAAQPVNNAVQTQSLPAEASTGTAPTPPPPGDTDSNGKPTRPIDQMSQMMVRMYQQRQQLQEQQNQQQQPKAAPQP